MSKFKKVKIDTIYSFTGDIIKSEIVERPIIGNQILFNNRWLKIEKVSNCNEYDFVGKIIDDVPEPFEFLNGGKLFPLK